MDNLLPYARPAPGAPGHAEAQARLNGEPSPAENHGNTGAKSWGNTHPPCRRNKIHPLGAGVAIAHFFQGWSIRQSQCECYIA
jgi:hypothetical protein